MAKKVAKLDEDKLLKKILDDPLLQAQIIDLNTEKQLYEEGIDADGNTLGTYSNATIYGTNAYEGKIAKGQRYDHITLNDTGAFYKSFKVKNEKEGFFITADTFKGGKTTKQVFDSNSQSVRGVKVGDTDLAEQYGKQIMGLTKDSLNEIIPEVRERFVESVRVAIGL